MTRSLSSAKQKTKLVSSHDTDDFDIPKVVTAKSKVTINHLKTLTPLTVNQQKVFADFDDMNMVLDGCPGSGKTFVSMYLAFRNILEKRDNFKKIILIRSVVPVRDIGFLPGSMEEKTDVYLEPYKVIIKEIFNSTIQNPFDKVKEQGLFEFMPTSFLRGTTLDNSIIIVDECQNMTGSELSTVLSRVGQNSKVIMCGDYFQSDLQKDKEKQGYIKIMEVLSNMEDVSFVEFKVEDIVRSGFVKRFIETKIKLGYTDL